MACEIDIRGSLQSKPPAVLLSFDSFVTQLLGAVGVAERQQQRHRSPYGLRGE